RVRIASWSPPAMRTIKAWSELNSEAVRTAGARAADPVREKATAMAHHPPLVTSHATNPAGQKRFLGFREMCAREFPYVLIWGPQSRRLRLRTPAQHIPH